MLAALQPKGAVGDEVLEDLRLVGGDVQFGRAFQGLFVPGSRILPDDWPAGFVRKSAAGDHLRPVQTYCFDVAPHQQTQLLSCRRGPAGFSGRPSLLACVSRGRPVWKHVDGQ